LTLIEVIRAGWVFANRGIQARMTVCVGGTYLGLMNRREVER
jgi:hypothetical protein